MNQIFNLHGGFVTELLLLSFAFVLSIFLFIPWIMIGVVPFVILGIQFTVVSWALFNLYRKNYFSDFKKTKMLPFEERQAQTEDKPGVEAVANVNANSNAQLDKPMNVMLVDDVPSSLIILEKILKQKNCNLTVVKSGMEALHELKSKWFDLLILDYSMPDLSGPETLKLADQLINAIEIMI